jgi:hypothetical protein
LPGNQRANFQIYLVEQMLVFLQALLITTAITEQNLGAVTGA